MIRRNILILALLLPAMPAVSADKQQPVTAQQEKKQGERTIPYGRATTYGLFRESGRGWVRKDKNTSTGQVIRQPTLEFVEQTDRIPLRQGVYFGYRYWLKVEPDKSRAELRRVLIHPEMTLPDGSKVTRSERTLRKKTTHGIVASLDGYALTEDYELVEGDWIFQLWSGDNMVVEAKFTTYWPEEEKGSEQVQPEK
jgi:hypothetical protein